MELCNEAETGSEQMSRRQIRPNEETVLKERGWSTDRLIALNGILDSI